MPIMGYDEFEFTGFYSKIPLGQIPTRSVYDELCDITRRAFVPRIQLAIYERSPIIEGVFGRVSDAFRPTSLTV